MKADELAAIREDVDRAVVEGYLNGDPQLLPDIVNRLLTAIGRVAYDAGAELAPGLVGDPYQRAEAWASGLLRDVQTRAISGIPYGEPTHDDEPEDHR